MNLKILSQRALALLGLTISVPVLSSGAAYDGVNDSTRLCSALPIEIVESIEFVARFPTSTQAGEVAASLNHEVFEASVSATESGQASSLLATYFSLPQESEHRRNVEMFRALVQQHGGEYIGLSCSSIAIPS